MENDSSYCITAGQFAKLCGTTRDTLRYYDKAGILVPKKNKMNGYNYYSPSQITSFLFINFFRTIGCPIKELKSYLEKEDTDSFNMFLHSQYDTLLTAKEELDRKLSVLSSGLDILDRAGKYPEGVAIMEHFEVPPRVFLTDVESSPATASGEIITDITRHIGRCRKTRDISSFPLGGVIDLEGIKRGIYTYKQVFSLISGRASGDGIQTLPSGDMVSCVIKDSLGDPRKHYDSIIDYIGTHGLTAKSDLFSLSLMNIVDIHNERKYMKYIFVCV